MFMYVQQNETQNLCEMAVLRGGPSATSHVQEQDRLNLKSGWGFLESKARESDLL